MFYFIYHNLCKSFLGLGLVLDQEELECKYSLEDMEFLLLLRRHCLHGTFENFDSVNNKNIKQGKRFTEKDSLIT